MPSLKTCSVYTLSVYLGSTIYTPGLQDVMEEFGVGQTAGSLGMALYVLAYGMGPMLFSPLSE
jgi:DHA1 family multidrug resistance protein-like MFS transporter